MFAISPDGGATGIGNLSGTGATAVALEAGTVVEVAVVSSSYDIY